MTKGICVVFYLEALRLGAGVRRIAQPIGIPHTPASRAGSTTRESRAQDQTRCSLQTKRPTRRKNWSSNRSVPFNPRFQPYLRFQQYLWHGSDPSFSPGQFAGSWAHPVLQRKLHTSDPWILHVVEGYQLDLIETPYQRRCPAKVQLKESMISEEVESLCRKQAKKAVLAQKDQFLSQIFLVPRKMVPNVRWSA